MSIDPRYQRRVNILSDYSNDLLDLIIEYTAFAAQQGVYDPEKGPVKKRKPGKKKKPEFSTAYAPAPALSPYEATEAQAEAWMEKQMGERGE